MHNSAAPWDDEFGLIDHLLAAVGSTPHDCGILVPPGDDAALLTPLQRPVISTDTQREGVHFKLAWQTPEEIGAKAVAVALSDLAAAYAQPRALFVNLGLPADLSAALIIRLYHGLGRSLEKYHCALGGGNISSAERLSLDLCAVGEGHAAIFPARANARPGDGVYCTGLLGLARAGLNCLLDNQAPWPELIDKFKDPTARFDAAAVLAGHGVRCVLDVSDGLAGDVAHLARASGVTVSLTPASLPVAPVLRQYCEHYHLNPLDLICSGGEDYELLFACPPETFEHLHPHLPEAYPLGQVLPYGGAYVLNLPAGTRSFQHGRV